MAETPEEFETLISGYLDGELTTEQRRQVEALAQSNAAFGRELETMKRLAVGTAAAAALDEPRPEQWEAFLDNVYNRTERNTGWVFLLVGLALLAGFGVWAFLVTPGLTALFKILIAIPIIGVGILFVSVLRERLRAAKTDRYTREVRW